MSGKRCCFQNCSNSVKNNKNVRFFKFPHSSTRREKWIESCEMLELESSSSGVVCSDHFEPQHFIHQTSKSGPLAWDALPTIPAKKNNESKEAIIYPMHSDWGPFLCRLCSQPISVKFQPTSHKVGVHIFGAEGKSLKLQHKINMCLPKPVLLEDSLPKFVCRVCIEHVIKTADMLSAFREVDQNLRTELNNKKNLKDLEDSSLQATFSLSIENYKCHHCDQTFFNLQELFEHELIHTSVLISDTDVPNIPLSCSECPNSKFSSRNLLEIHVLEKHKKIEVVKLKSKPIKPKINLEKSVLVKKSTGKSILKTKDETTTYINLVKSSDGVSDTEYITVNEDISYICSYCEMIFNDLKLFKRHIKIQHKNKIKCDHCNKMYTEKGLKLHQDRVKNQQEYICDMCKKIFTLRHYLVSHIKNTHTDKKLPCTKCSRTFKSKEGLTGHLMQHEGIYKYLCDICGKSFLTQSTMRIHRRKHTEQNFFTCEHCGKKIQEHNRFQDHLRTHTGETPFGCQLCTRKFHSKKLLKQHMQIHDDIRPYKCTQCNLSFKRVGNLKAHMERHTNYRPICSICRLSFDTCSERNIHRRTHTQEEREKIKSERLNTPKGPKRNRNQFLCKGCNTVFGSKDEKNEHIASNPDHMNVIKCDSCDKTFRSQQSLTVHQSVHTGERPYACSFCLKTFRTYSTCRQHTQIHSTQGQYKCNQCERTFHRQYTLNVHLRSHSNERPFQCNVCGRGFKQNQDMKKHLKLHKENKWGTGQFMLENTSVEEQILEQTTTITIPTEIQQDLQLATSNIVITVPFNVTQSDTQNFFTV